MKILYLKLKNFANIYTAMNKKTVEIDFTKCKNRVVLLIGANGSGKTSILSELQPFAYVGSLDVRNGTNLILDDNDGYKEIHIQHDESVYIIKHFYKNTKRGILLKSFISKDGVELNPNGNVTSFNETVQKELSLEQNYLKLLRLGSNVTNLIEMKATERKNFTSDLLSDIDVYNQLYKKVNDDTRLLRSLIKTVSDKIDKLNVVDTDLLKSEIEVLDNKLKELNKEKERLQTELGKMDGLISALVPEGVESFNLSIKGLRNELSNIDDSIKRLKKKKDSKCVVISGDISSDIDTFKDNKSILEKDILVDSTNLLSLQTQQNDLYNDRDKLKEDIKHVSSLLTERELMQLYVDLKMKCDELSKKYKGYTPKYTKENIMDAIHLLREINGIAYNIYEFDSSQIKETVRLIRSQCNIDKYVEEHIEVLNRKIDSYNRKSKLDIQNQTIVLFRPSECKIDNCPYLKLYDEFFGKDKDEGPSIISLNDQKDKYQQIADISKNITYIMVILKSNFNLINKVNISYFTIDSILSRLETFKDIYDEDKMTEIVSDIEDYEEFINMKSKLSEIKSELNTVSGNQQSLDLLNKSLLDIELKISGIEKTISDLQSSISIKKSNLQRVDDTIDVLTEYQDILNELETLYSERDKLNNTLNEKSMIIKKVSEHEAMYATIETTLSNITWSIKNIENDIFDKKVIMKDFNILQKELKTLNKKFDDCSMIRESLSSNKGIPLLYIQLYLKNTKMYVNELLESIYGGMFEIDDFEINSSEFNIPYIKNGIRINDVVYASQGERSFLSLALSFALITQSIKDYNILLLDELDSTLDYRNRPLFLNILEKQMNSINAEQIFLITHNDMFDSYPVDVILTSNVENSITGSKSKNIIYK